MLLLLSGCATDRAGIRDPVEQHQITTELGEGRLRLACELPCAGTWLAARKTLRGLYQQQLWQDLALEVVRIGHPSDLGYFYLGRAAEGLGRPAAAALYYRMAMASTSKCDGLLLNRCDGVRLPADAQAALLRLGPR